jgi:hypothetical protein
MAPASAPRVNQGVPAGLGALTGGGDVFPKSKFTVGAFSAPGCALKKGFGGKPNMPAKSTVGKLRTAVL